MKLNALGLSITLLFACSAHADDHQEGAYIGVFGDYYSPDWDKAEKAMGIKVDESTRFGAELGYRFSKYWSARFEYADLDFDLKNSSNSLEGERYGIDALHHINGGPFYGLIGLKSLKSFDRNKYANIGLGYRHQVADQLFVNAETALYQGLDDSYTDVNAKLGINYAFGAKPASKEVVAAPAPVIKKEVKQPIDSDKDGVIDDNDQCADTPMVDAVDNKGCSLYKDNEVTIRLLINFPNNNSAVSKQYLEDMSAVITFLNQHPDTKVQLEGHTSSVGKAKYNQWLSEKRAAAVAKQLISAGIDESRVSSVGFGETRLKNTEDNEQAHKENRRVEANITSTERVKVKR